ncbi:unnamed protein product [Cylicostephanus goldi]|uniref:Uncharacterized protein n=1 Tax=Cylicostephanus goldi TaxID=71465 RepID=A0A3P6Q6J0_CYLGO|nr:unnamed protein product [Cylicostephanus goldi]
MCLALVNGLDDFEKRKRFHDRQCELTPSLPSCTTPYKLAVFKRETMSQDNNNRLQKLSKAMGVKRTVKRSSWYDDDDEDYEFYLWKKYRREKLRRRLLQNSGDSSESVQYHYHNYNSPYSSGYRAYPYTGYYRPSYG